MRLRSEKRIYKAGKERRDGKKKEKQPRIESSTSIWSKSIVCCFAFLYVCSVFRSHTTTEGSESPKQAAMVAASGPFPYRDTSVGSAGKSIDRRPVALS